MIIISIQWRVLPFEKNVLLISGTFFSKLQWPEHGMPSMHFKLGCRRYFITAHQRSCVCLSVCSHGGPMWPCDHYPWHWTSPVATDVSTGWGSPCEHYPWCPGPHHTGFSPPVYRDPSGPSLAPISDIWWPRPKTCSNVFTWWSPSWCDIWQPRPETCSNFSTWRPPWCSLMNNWN